MITEILINERGKQECQSQSEAAQEGIDQPLLPLKVGREPGPKEFRRPRGPGKAKGTDGPLQPPEETQSDQYFHQVQCDWFRLLTSRAVK